MTWKKAKLGEVCTIEKGNIGIMKAVPGEFPLVVLGEERKTHNSYQFDDEAVIIPLISSTGHGHRSMKRIFLQRGKFSVGSILCAVIPKDKTQLSAEFLYRYLDFNKENELVSRMKGMANVSLPIKEIAAVEIPLPPIEHQTKLIKEFQTLEAANNQITVELSHQLELVHQLRQAFLREALQGELVPQDDTDEPASILLERIRDKKGKLLSTTKTRQEKFLPEIKAEEKPFDIPSGWAWIRMGSICDLITSGSRGWAQFYSNSGAIFVRMGNLSRNSFQLRMHNIQYVDPPKNSEGDRTRLEENDILVSITGEVGNLGLIPKNFGEAYINQHTGLIRLNKNIYPKYIAFACLSKLLQDQFNAPQRGLKNSFRLSDIDFLLLPLPPLNEQKRIAKKLEKLMIFCDEFETNIRESRLQAENLLQVALKEALEPKDVTTSRLL